MSMKAWIKRPTHKPNHSAMQQNVIAMVALKNAEVVPKPRPGEFSLKFTLANSKVLETNSFLVPVASIKGVKAVEKLGGDFVFEIELSDGRKIETAPLQRLPPTSPTATVVAPMRDTLFATSAGVDAARRSKLIIQWDKDYDPANSQAIKVQGSLCIVDKGSSFRAGVFEAIGEKTGHGNGC